MRQKRVVAVTVETMRMRVRRTVGQMHVWCARCSAYVQAVTLEDAAALLGASTSEIYTLTEAGTYHLVEAEGSYQICLRSLIKQIDKQSHN